MAVPRIALVVPLLLGGFLLPAASAEPEAPPAGMSVNVAAGPLAPPSSR
jgi:hypothetical protein